MRLDEAADDGQAESRASLARASPRAQTLERLEDPLPLGLGTPGPWSITRSSSRRPERSAAA